MRTEHDEQVDFINWCGLMSAYQPKEYGMLQMIFAIPNGGARNKVTGARLKKEGVKSGVPDLFLPYPSKGYHGLFIEMKRANGGRLSKTQDWWIDQLDLAGYSVAICHGSAEAIQAVEDYILDVDARANLNTADNHHGRLDRLNVSVNYE